YIFPYLVANLIKFRTPEDREIIIKELMVILNHNGTGSEHAQVVFTLIDVLRKWVEKFKQTEEGQKDVYLKHKVYYENIESLLSQIPYDVLAMSAYRNKAYSRAFMYYESYLRRTKY